MLSFTRKAFFGPITQNAINKIQDLRPRELAILCIPALLILVLGFSPNTLLETNQVAAEAWISSLLEQPIMKNNELLGLLSQ